MSFGVTELIHYLSKRRPAGFLFALCRRPITTSALGTLVALAVSAFIHSGQDPVYSFVFRHTNEYIDKSIGFFWGTHLVVCSLMLVSFPLVYMALVRPVVLSYRHEKPSEWQFRWQEVDSRVKHCLFSLVVIFLSWTLIYVSYLLTPESQSSNTMIDVLVWINGLAFLYLWYALRGRSVRQEHKAAIDRILDKLPPDGAAGNEEAVDDGIYDLFTPWEYRGEALLTNSDVTPREVKKQLELERQAVSNLDRSDDEREPVAHSELATAEVQDAFVMIILVLVTVLVPAGFFFARINLGIQGLESIISFYVACIVAGTSIGLVATRLANVYVDVSSIVVAAIVLYAALQPAFPFENLLRHVEPTVIDVAQTTSVGGAGADSPAAAGPTSSAAVPEAKADRAAMAKLQTALRLGLFSYALFGKLVIGFVFLQLLLNGRLYYYIYYLQRSRALLLVHRKLTMQSFPLSSKAR